MGKKRSISVKKIAEMLIIASYNPNRFTADFEANKSLVNEITNLPSKVVRNKVVGYITRTKRGSSKVSVQYGNSNPYRKGRMSRIRR